MVGKALVCGSVGCELVVSRLHGGFPSGIRVALEVTIPHIVGRDERLRRSLVGEAEAVEHRPVVRHCGGLLHANCQSAVCDCHCDRRASVEPSVEVRGSLFLRVRDITEGSVDSNGAVSARSSEDGRQWCSNLVGVEHGVERLVSSRPQGCGISVSSVAVESLARKYVNTVRDACERLVDIEVATEFLTVEIIVGPVDFGTSHPTAVAAVVAAHVGSSNEECGIARGNCSCEFFHKGVLCMEGPQRVGVIGVGCCIHLSRCSLTAEVVASVGGDEVCGLSVGVGGFHKSPCDGSPVHEVVTA